MVRSSFGAPALNATEAPVMKMRVTPGGLGIAGARRPRNCCGSMYVLCHCPGSAPYPTNGVITVRTDQMTSSSAFSFIPASSR